MVWIAVCLFIVYCLLKRRTGLSQEDVCVAVGFGLWAIVGPLYSYRLSYNWFVWVLGVMISPLFGLAIMMKMRRG